jgi:predicted membrane-bound spermidine synthase
LAFAYPSSLGNGGNFFQVSHVNQAHIAASPPKSTSVDLSASIDSTAQHRLIMPIVFVGGMSSIGIELATSRLLAPYFGTSTFIWANLIGLTLAYLALGYYIGGIVADRYPSATLLYAITAVAGFSAGLIPFLARPVLRSSLGAIDNVDAGAFYGSLIGVIVLLAIPVTLFGCVTPFAIRLRSKDISSAGNTAGRVWALSTVGSILGSFLPVLVLIPLLGTRVTFLVMSLAVVILSAIGLLASQARAVAVAGLILAAILVTMNAAIASTPIKPPYRGSLVEESESAYHYIQVLNDDGAYLLALNEGHAIHSIFDPANPLTGGPWDYFGIAPLFLNESGGQLERSLIVGLAGGTAARTILEIYPDSTVDGVEIDSEIVRLGEKYFALNDPRINTYVEDGRYFLTTSNATYDLIGIDAYRQPYIPFHLTTREFFEEVANRLSETGMVVVNAGRSETDFRLVDSLASTMLSVFPYVYLVDAERYENTLIYGTFTPSSIQQFAENATGLDPGSLGGTIAQRAVATGNIRIADASVEPYTDDLAPVEWLVDRMIVDAAREEEP